MADCLKKLLGLCCGCQGCPGQTWAEVRVLAVQNRVAYTTAGPVRLNPGNHPRPGGKLLVTQEQGALRCHTEQPPRAAGQTPQRRATPRPSVPDDVAPLPIWDSPQWHSSEWEPGGTDPNLIGMTADANHIRTSDAEWVDHQRGQYGRLAQRLPPAEPPLDWDVVASIQQRGSETELSGLIGQEVRPALYSRRDYLAARGTSGSQYYADWIQGEDSGWQPAPLRDDWLRKSVTELEAEGWQFWVDQASAAAATRVTFAEIDRPDRTALAVDTYASARTWDSPEVQEVVLDSEPQTLRPETWRGTVQAEYVLTNQTPPPALIREYRVSQWIDQAGNWELWLEGKLPEGNETPVDPVSGGTGPTITLATITAPGGQRPVYINLPRPTPGWVSLRLLSISGGETLRDMPEPDAAEQRRWDAIAQAHYQADPSRAELLTLRDWDTQTRVQRIEAARKLWPGRVLMTRSWPLPVDSQERPLPPLWRWRPDNELTMPDIAVFTSPDGQVSVSRSGNLRVGGTQLGLGSWTALRDNPVRREDGTLDHSPYFVLHEAGGVVTRADPDGSTEQLGRSAFEREILRSEESGVFLRFGVWGRAYHSWPPQRGVAEGVDGDWTLLAWDAWRDAIKAPPPDGQPAHWYWPARPGRRPGVLPATAPRPPLGVVWGDNGTAEPLHAKGQHPLRPPPSLAYLTEQGWQAVPAERLSGNQLFQPVQAADTRRAASVGRSAGWRVGLPAGFAAYTILFRVRESAGEEPLTVSHTLPASVMLAPQGRNVGQRGWQPYRLTLFFEGEPPGTAVLTFSRPVQTADWLLFGQNFVAN